MDENTRKLVDSTIGERSLVIDCINIHNMRCDGVFAAKAAMEDKWEIFGSPTISGRLTNAFL